jgi:uncharacterized protein (TIGR03437 family)
VPLALVIVLSSSAAVSQVVEWSHRTGTIDRDEAFGVAVDSSGVYLAGYADDILPDLDEVGKQDAFLRKYDAAGNVLWTRQFGSVFDDAAMAVAAHASGIYVVGSVGPQAEEDFTNDNRRDIFLRRYDAAGNLLWSRQVDSVGTPQNDAALSVVVSGQAVYIAGYTRGTLPGQNPQGGFDAFLSKYDLSGTALWTRQFGTADIDRAVGVAADASGIYVLGETDGALPGQSYAGGLFDIFLRKYDANGTELWTRQFGSTGFEFAGGVAADSSGVYLVGATSGSLPGASNSSGYDAFVRKYSPAGAELWTRQFGASGDALAYGAALSGGNLFVTGNVVGMLPGQLGAGGFNEDVFVRKYDGGGTELWTRQFGTDVRDTAAGIAADSSGIYVAGAVPRILLSPSATGDWDALLTKLVETPLVSPVINSGGVVNAARLQTQGASVAGSLASLFGLNFLSPGQDSVVVQLNGIAAPLFAVTDTQINFQVPWELAGLPEASVTVTVGGRTSNTVTMPLSSAAPGLFSTNAAGSGQGAVLVANTSIVAAPTGAFSGSRPARRGEFLSIYGTGWGAVSDQPPTGLSASVSPLSHTLATPTVTIGGVAAAVSFAGLAPGFVGLYQANVQVPAEAPGGEAISVTLSIGGAASNPVTIALQ